jgi:hypothetical protein
MSLVMLATLGSNPLGRLQSGMLVGLIGGPAAILIGAGAVGAVILGCWRMRLTDDGGKS